MDRLCISSRAVIIEQNRLLLVSNDGKIWVTPGGHIEKNETLHAGLLREMYEETGLTIEVRELISVSEFFDLRENSHKVEFHFACKRVSGELSKQWVDRDESVRFAEFFSFDKVRKLEKVYPDFIKRGEWRYEPFNVYKGYAKE